MSHIRRGQGFHRLDEIATNTLRQRGFELFATVPPANPSAPMEVDG
jgi:hypothetical protein